MLLEESSVFPFAAHARKWTVLADPPRCAGEDLCGVWMNPDFEETDLQSKETHHDACCNRVCDRDS